MRDITTIAAESAPNRNDATVIERGNRHIYRSGPAAVAAGTARATIAIKRIPAATAVATERSDDTAICCVRSFNRQHAGASAVAAQSCSSPIPASNVACSSR